MIDQSSPVLGDQIPDEYRDRSPTRAHVTRYLYCNEKCAQRDLMKCVHITMNSEYTITIREDQFVCYIMLATVRYTNQSSHQCLWTHSILDIYYPIGPVSGSVGSGVPSNRGLTRPEPITVFISDRQKGVLEEVEFVFPGSPHGYCWRHLYENMYKEFKYP